ncbi:hypothetical protein D3C80_1732100 [compost metagenome]
MQVADNQADGRICHIALDGLVGGMGRCTGIALGFEELTQLLDNDRLVINQQNLDSTYWSGHDQLPVRMRLCSRA